MAGRRTRLDAAERYFLLPQEEVERIDEEVQLSSEFEELAESTIRRREDTKAEIEIFWTRKGNIADPWTLPVQAMTTLLKTWMTVKVEGTKPSPKRVARGATHVTYSTLKSWFMSIVRIVSKHVTEGQKTLNDSLYTELCKHKGYLTVRYKLEVLQDRKQFCGRNEIRLMTETMWANCQDLEWTLQTDLVLKTIFMTGVRPGSCSPSTEKYLREGRFLKWGDVHVMVKAFAEFWSDISFTALKGYNLIAAKRHEANLRPATRPDNVIFEVAPPLLLLALHRGIIKGVTTLDELLACRNFRLEWEDWALDQPIFLRGKIGGHPGCQSGVAMRAKGITEALATVGRAVGLAQCSIDFESYDLRRNFGDEIEENYGEAGAQIGLTHTKNSRTFGTNYGRQSANLDGSGAVLHEDLANRYELNQYRTPALEGNVGLANETVERLIKMTERATTASGLDTSARQLKRRADAIIIPSAAPPTPYIDRTITDTQCCAHPYWLDFVRDTEFRRRESEMLRHSKIFQAALDDIPALPGHNPHRTPYAKLAAAYPDNPELLDALATWRQLKSIHDAAARRKIHAIRAAISLSRASTSSGTDGPVDTYDLRQARVEQFADHSMLVDLAFAHAKEGRPGPSASTSTNDRASASKVAEQPPIDDLLDPNFVPFEE
ncbi:hypothetical protein C8F04DRAFT_1328615, partial [Mycena alexandri]